MRFITTTNIPSLNKSLYFISILVLLSFFARAQRYFPPDSSFSGGLFFGNYTYQIPGGDMAKRFGNNSNIGGGFLFKTSNNWLYGAEGNYIFGSTIREDSILKNISTPGPDGGVIGSDGIFAETTMYERGFYVAGKVGKIFNFGSGNPNNGLIVLCGGGFLQHKIRIEVADNTAPQLAGDYKRGYDRLTNGWAASQFIGYMYFGNTRIFNFFVGLEVIEAWTKNRRDYNFDTMSKDTKSRFDLLTGFKFGWVIPLYKRSEQMFFYN